MTPTLFNKASFLLLGLLAAASTLAENWPQAAGPNANWKIEGNAPTSWSVVQDQNIKWRTTLPEGGQSGIAVWGDKIFLTTHLSLQSADEVSTTTDIVGYCLDSSNGKILWSVELPGSIAAGTAVTFSDATVFSPVTDGEHVWFFNRGGSMACYDLSGNRVWIREYTPRTRHGNRQCEPILFNNQLLVVEVLDKEAAKKLERHQPIPDGIDPKSVWTYVHAIDAQTGAVLWNEPAGTIIHTTPMIAQRANGDWALLHARGGPHEPLETPYGLSLTSLAPGEEGKVLWSVEIENIHSMLNNHWNAKHAYAFSGEYHLVLDTETGRELSRRSVRENVTRWQHDEASGTWDLKTAAELGKRPRIATYQTNIVIGDWHYFLSHELNSIGRVNTRTQEVEYLDVPVQLAVSPDGIRKEIWDPKQAIPNVPINSRGIDLTLDPRSTRSGWGHNSAASPILVGKHLYFPVMSGTVYVINTEATEFSDKAIVAINDLGPSGTTWSLSGLSYSDNKLYARTIKEVICIENSD